MPRPWRIQYPGAKYHVTVRGNGRQVVFHDDDYYSHFMGQLADALEKDGVVLLAYVLMPNHFHLFAETPRANISRFMQRLNTAYSMYHRCMRGQPGHCFQGRYGAKVVRGDDYVLRLTRYIHLNPVKGAAWAGRSPAERRAFLKSYRWSSYSGYVDGRLTEEIVNYQCLRLVPGRSATERRAAYRRYVERYISEEDDEFVGSLSASRYAVGDAEFIGEIEGELNDVRARKGIYGDIAWPEIRPMCLDEIAKAVAETFGVQQECLRTRGCASRVAKKVALELSCRHGGQSQRKVGEYFGYKGNGSVLKQRQHLARLLGEDPGLRQRMEELERRLAGG